MNFQRASGILLHPTSLPNNFGIGDFGSQAFEFVDFLVGAKQSYWQILPLGQTGYGDSPYQCFSAFAGNILLISPEKVVEDGFLSADDLRFIPKFQVGKVDYSGVLGYKTVLLKKAFENFRRTDDAKTAESFHKFCDENAFWLEDYSLFRAISSVRKQVSWQRWDEDLKMRKLEALNAARRELDDELFAQKFYQWLFFKQWNELKSYANGKKIKIVGDVPIFVALDSADVWCNPAQFKLNEDGSPRVVAGVPPDYFSKTGQLWGNPIYDWENMRRDGFKWWIDRVRFTLQIVDVLRVDHFRGFAASWEVPAKDETAENGRWVNVPGKELFTTLKKTLGDLPILAEDLGVITPDVEELRDEFGFPGMRILQYAFGGDPKNRDLPHNYTKNAVAYTGTHDNDTTVGWFESKTEKAPNRDGRQTNAELDFCLGYLNSDGREIHWDCIRAVIASIADTAIIPMQDLLGLGNEARMNLPATNSGNWSWRCEKSDMDVDVSERLRELTEIYGRAN